MWSFVFVFVSLLRNEWETTKRRFEERGDRKKVASIKPGWTKKSTLFFFPDSVLLLMSFELFLVGRVWKMGRFHLVFGVPTCVTLRALASLGQGCWRDGLVFLSVRGLCCGGCRWWLSGVLCPFTFPAPLPSACYSESLRPNCTFSLCLGFLVLFFISVIFVHVPAKHGGWIFHVQLFFFFIVYTACICLFKMDWVKLK